MSWCRKCASCFYARSLAGANLSERIGYCNYAEIEGHIRSTICPPGEACTVWKQQNARPKIDEAAAERLYREGLNDRTIARRLNVTEYRVRAWRQENGYGKRVQHTFSEETARRLYEAGMTDEKAAKELGIATNTYKKWRLANHLERKRVDRRSERMMSAYLDGLTDTQAAKELGITRDTMQKWRTRNGLPPQRTARYADRNKKILRMHREGMSTKEIAERLDTTYNTVYHAIRRETNG